MTGGNARQTGHGQGGGRAAGPPHDYASYLDPARLPGGQHARELQDLASLQAASGQALSLFTENPLPLIGTSPLGVVPHANRAAGEPLAFIAEPGRYCPPARRMPRSRRCGRREVAAEGGKQREREVMP